MKRTRAGSFGLWLPVMLVLGLSMTAALPLKAASSTIVGDWEGTLNPGAQAKKRIVAHISVGQDGILSGTIDYPEQDVSGILITAITYKGSTLHFEVASSQGSYDGVSNSDNSEISGTWKQGGAGVNLILKRTP